MSLPFLFLCQPPCFLPFEAQLWPPSTKRPFWSHGTPVDQSLQVSSWASPACVLGTGGKIEEMNQDSGSQERDPIWRRQGQTTCFQPAPPLKAFPRYPVLGLVEGVSRAHPRRPQGPPSLSFTRLPGSPSRKTTCPHGLVSRFAFGPAKCPSEDTGLRDTERLTQLSHRMITGDYPNSANSQVTGSPCFPDQQKETSAVISNHLAFQKHTVGTGTTAGQQRDCVSLIKQALTPPRGLSCCPESRAEASILSACVCFSSAAAITHFRIKAGSLKRVWRQPTSTELCFPSEKITASLCLLRATYLNRPVTRGH